MRRRWAPLRASRRSKKVVPRPRALGLGGDDGGGELSGIACEDGAVGAGEGDEGDGVDGLGGLVEDDEIEALSAEVAAVGAGGGGAEDLGAAEDDLLGLLEVLAGVSEEAVDLASGVFALIPGDGASLPLALGASSEAVGFVGPLLGEAGGGIAGEEGVEGVVFEAVGDAGGVSEAHDLDPGGDEAQGEVVGGGVAGGGGEHAVSACDVLSDDLDQRAGLAGAWGAVDEGELSRGEGEGDGFLLRGVEGAVKEGQIAGEGVQLGLAEAEEDVAEGGAGAAGLGVAEGLNGASSAQKSLQGLVQIEADAAFFEALVLGIALDHDADALGSEARDDAAEGVGCVGAVPPEHRGIAGLDPEGVQIEAGAVGEPEEGAPAGGGLGLVHAELLEGDACLDALVERGLVADLVEAGA
jgi:hypothetical protein